MLHTSNDLSVSIYEIRYLGSTLYSSESGMAEIFNFRKRHPQLKKNKVLEISYNCWAIRFIIVNMV